MAGTTSVPGGSVPGNFTPGFASAIGVTLNQILAGGFNTVTGTTIPTATTPNLVIPPTVSGANLVVTDPNYTTIVASGTNDTITAGGATVILGGSGNVLNTGSGGDFVYATGSDTINAVVGNNTVVGGAAPVSVNGAGSSSLYFVGGSGPVTATGGANATLFGGTGGAPSVLTGGTNASEIALGAGATSLVAGSGNSTLNGGGSTGFDTYSLGGAGSTALVTLGSGASTIIGGAGASTVWAGTSTVAGSGGSEVYSFVNGHAGGSMVIYGLEAANSFSFNIQGYSAAAKESVSGGSDTITLPDGTTIVLVGVGHTVL